VRRLKTLEDMPLRFTLKRKDSLDSIEIHQLVFLSWDLKKRRGRGNLSQGKWLGAVRQN
jgi:hypothetical protein